jgi:polysaccharide export outer membrane protein
MEIVERMKMSRVFICLPILAVWLLVPSMLVAQEQVEPGPGPAADEYEVQPGDLLFISVWKEPELQKDVLVRPDGAFSFPLCGEIDGRNKTVEDLRVEISNRLSRYIPDLIVTVSVLEINGNKVYVIGQVNEPGEFVVNPRVDVMQALSMAGGATAFANLNDVKILRRTPNGQVAIEFRYDDVVRGRNLEQNILLESGDVVVVP